jgi:hypothetical protein
MNKKGEKRREKVLLTLELRNTEGMDGKLVKQHC